MNKTNMWMQRAEWWLPEEKRRGGGQNWERDQLYSDECKPEF